MRFGCSRPSSSPSRPSAARRPTKRRGSRGRSRLTVRTDAGNLWVGAHAWTETRRTWEKPAQGKIEELTIRPIEGGHEITFLQGGLLWRGEVDADHKARGPLQVVPSADAGSDVASRPRATERPATDRARDAGFGWTR
jgi:hypothetical protein